MVSNSEIETRLATLESELENLKLEFRAKRVKPWWEAIVGSFANDEAYDEAMQLGRDYRESLPPRVPGTALGMITIAPDFDDDLPDDILDAFETEHTLKLN